MLGGTVPSTADDLSFALLKTHSPSRLSGSTNSAISYSLQLGLGKKEDPGSFGTRRENLRYTERCTFGSISLEHRTPRETADCAEGSHTSLDSHPQNPLRSLGLLFVRKGMLRTGAMRLLPRLSHDSFSCLKSCAPTEIRPVPVPFRPAPRHYAV
jgi:hypothetical protein